MISILSWFKALRRRNPFLRGVIEIAGGTWLGHTFTLLASPVLSRLYGPEAFGTFQIYLSVLMVMSVIMALRYEMAILLPEEEEVAFGVVVLGLGITGIMVVALLASLFLVWVFGCLPSLLKPLGASAFLIPIGAGLAGIYQDLTFWAIRKEAYRSISSSKLSQAAAQAGGQLGHGYWVVPSSAGLILGDCLGRIGAILPLVRVYMDGVRRFPSCLNLRLLRQVAYRFRRFPLISSWGALVNALGLTVPAIMLLQQFGAALLGWYALADRVVGLPTVLLGQSVSQVFMGEAGRLSKAEPGKLIERYRGLLKRLMAFGLIPTGVLVVGGPWLFARVFGEQWLPAGQVARLLALNHYCAFVAWPLIPTLLVLERQDLQTAWDIGRLIAVASALTGARLLGLGMTATLLLLGIVGAASYLVHILITYRELKRRVKTFGLGALDAEQ